MMLIYSREYIKQYDNTIVLTDLDDYIIELYTLLEIPYISFPIQINYDDLSISTHNFYLKNLEILRNRNYYIA